jgi:predicted nucleotidyltransferase
MKYVIAKKDIQNDLLAETLSALTNCFRQINAEVYVVGAVARDLAFLLLKAGNTARRTMDLDVAVMLADWSQYERLSEILLNNNFAKAPEKQRFVYLGAKAEAHYVVDVVPFGSLAEKGRLAWPPEGSPVMSVRCTESVMRYADEVEVDNKFAFKIASLSGQFLIKLDAWMDRGISTRKDAYDMVYILQNVYVAYALAHEVLPDEVDIDAEHFDVAVAGAEWIASDLAKILSEEDRFYYADVLWQEIEKEEDSKLINDLLDVSDSRNYALFRRAINSMIKILRG